MNIKALVIISSLLIYQNCFSQAYISGNIENYKNKNVTISYNSDGLLFGNFTKIRTKTNEHGDFSARADYLYNIGTYNWIKVGKRSIYFSLVPNDSLIININSIKEGTVEFLGKNSSRSYYCNDYYKYLRKRRRAFNKSFFSKRSVTNLKNDYEDELLFLEKKKIEHNLDLEFYEYLKEYLKYSHINRMSINKFDTTAYFKEFAKDFNLQNETLKNNSVYYSSMAAYYYDYLGVNWDWNSIEGIIKGIEQIKVLNKHPYSEIFAGYILSYFIWTHKYKPVLGSVEFNEVLTKYLDFCTDKIAKQEIEGMILKFRTKQ